MTCFDFLSGYIETFHMVILIKNYCCLLTLSPWMSSANDKWFFSSNFLKKVWNSNFHVYIWILHKKYIHLNTNKPYPGGGTRIFGRTGMCRSNGPLFYKKSLNMGPVFYQKILKHGSTFLTEPKFSGFHMAKTPKIVKFVKNGPIFQEESLKMGTLFCQNHP